MKEVAAAILAFTSKEIREIESNGFCKLNLNGEFHDVRFEDVEIITEDIPGWLVTNEGKITVALDINVTEDLRKEGIARELINRIQNLRKESGFEVTDKISLIIQKHELINSAVELHKNYIGTQTLALQIELVDNLEPNISKSVEIDESIKTLIKIEKLV
jgi:isoleucyl-tRNA synthetase